MAKNYGPLVNCCQVFFTKPAFQKSNLGQPIELRSVARLGLNSDSLVQSSL
jgi:hypothetical protein